MSELKINQKGFSLLEMLVVMVMMMIIMGGVFTLMRGAITTANANYEMTDAQQGLRNSQEFLIRDILTAGDGLKGVSNIWLPTNFVADYLTIRPAAELDPTSWGYVNVGAILSDDNMPSGVKVPGTNPETNVLARTDRLTMLSADPDFSTIDIAPGGTDRSTGRISIPASRIDDFTVGEIYYITSGGTGAFGVVTVVDKAANAIYWGNGDALNFNRTGSTGLLAAATNNGSSASTLKRVQIIHYFVDADSRMIRRAFGVKGSSFVDSVVAEHIISAQFRYVSQPADTGTLIFSQPVNQVGMNDLSQIRIIEPTIIVQTARFRTGISGKSNPRRVLPSATFNFWKRRSRAIKTAIRILPIQDRCQR